MRDILQSRYLRSNVAHKQLARTSLKARTAKKRYDTSCRTCTVFQARAMRGTPAECANVLAHSICKFEGRDRKHEMRHEHSELREKSQIALQFTAEKVARGMDG